MAKNYKLEDDLLIKTRPWSNLVDNWHTLEIMLEKKDGEGMYELMKSLT